MNEYYPNPRVVETSGTGNIWGPLVAAGVVGLFGYFIGRNNNGCNNGPCCGGNSGQTVFQQGEYAGEGRAADNFVANQVNKLENMLVAMNNDMKDQRISEQAGKIQSLETRMLVSEATGGIACQLGQVNRTLDSVTTGCAFKSYPGNRNCGF